MRRGKQLRPGTNPDRRVRDGLRKISNATWTRWVGRRAHQPTSSRVSEQVNTNERQILYIPTKLLINKFPQGHITNSNGL